MMLQAGLGPRPGPFKARGRTRVKRYNTLHVARCAVSPARAALSGWARKREKERANATARCACRAILSVCSALGGWAREERERARASG